MKRLRHSDAFLIDIPLSDSLQSITNINSFETIESITIKLGEI